MRLDLGDDEEKPRKRGAKRLRKALRVGRQAHIIATSISTVLVFFFPLEEKKKKRERISYSSFSLQRR